MQKHFVRVLRKRFQLVLGASEEKHRTENVFYVLFYETFI